MRTNDALEKRRARRAKRAEGLAREHRRAEVIEEAKAQWGQLKGIEHDATRRLEEARGDLRDLVQAMRENEGMTAAEIAQALDEEIKIIRSLFLRSVEDA